MSLSQPPGYCLVHFIIVCDTNIWKTFQTFILCHISMNLVWGWMTPAAVCLRNNPLNVCLFLDNQILAHSWWWSTQYKGWVWNCSHAGHILWLSGRNKDIFCICRFANNVVWYAWCVYIFPFIMPSWHSYPCWPHSPLHSQRLAFKEATSITESCLTILRAGQGSRSSTTPSIHHLSLTKLGRVTRSSEKDLLCHGGQDAPRLGFYSLVMNGR